MRLPARRLGCINRITRASAVYPDRSNVVLTYHSIGGGGYGAIPPEVLADHCRQLSSAYEIVDLPDVVAGEAAGDKKVAVTFEDGYRDFYTHALPVLRRFDVPATVFVISDALDGHEVLRHCNYDPMTRAQIDALIEDDLVTIGNHTRRHPRISDIEDDAVLRDEIAGAKANLEAEFGITIDRFSYPYNDTSQAAAAVVREGHAYAVKGDGLFDRITPETDPYRIPRISGAYPTDWVTFATTDLARDVGRLTHRLVGEAFTR